MRGIALVCALLSACVSAPKDAAYAPPIKHVVCDADRGTVARADVHMWMHDGPCGACSTPRDLRAYRRTKRTLTDDATRCAFEMLLFGREFGARCLRKRAGFSAACTTCWLDNMACTASKCRGLCIFSRLAREPKTINGRLNGCLACDERECGPSFMRCAGATRRRAGIVTDIARPRSQISVFE